MSGEELENFGGEKGDLAFVVGFEVEETISPQTLTRDTFDRFDRNGGMLSGGFTVVAKVVVAGGNVELENLHECRNQSAGSGASNCSWNEAASAAFTR